MAGYNYCKGQITMGLGVNCDDLMVKGIEQRGVIINRVDINFDVLEWDATRKNVITNLALKSGGVKGYEVIIPTQQPFSGTGTTLGDGTVRKTFTNTLGMVVLANDPDVCEQGFLTWMM